jgi:predicted nicotinamide N-methyase
MSEETNNHFTFSIPSANSSKGTPPLKIHLHQAPSADTNQGLAETNTGFVMWPSAVMLSHYLSKNPSIVLGDDTTPDGDVMELGAGCGLVGLTAATLLQNNDNSNNNTDATKNSNDDENVDGNDASSNTNGSSQDKVIFTDYNPAVLENLQRNVDLNDFDVDHQVFGLDWFDQIQEEEEKSSDDHDTDEDVGGKEEEVEEVTSEQEGGEEGKNDDTWVDTDGKSHAQVRLILGADLLVCTNDANLVASTIDSALMDGGSAFILGADEYARFGVRDFPDACRSLGLKVTVQEDLLYDSNFFVAEDHMDELELGGYNQRASSMGHDFTMFTVSKPIAASS